MRMETACAASTARIDRLSALPGAVAVGAISHLPPGGQHVERGFTPEGWQPSPDQQAVARLRGIVGRYVDALGARVTAGRAFTDAEHTTSQLVAIVNDEFARRYWPGQNPAGKRLKQGDLESDDPWRIVVGVYADLKLGPEAETRPEVMLPYAQIDEYWVTQ
jgi:hypothetical protein